MQPVTFNVISVFSVRLGVFCQCCCCCLRWMFVNILALLQSAGGAAMSSHKWLDVETGISFPSQLSLALSDAMPEWLVTPNLFKINHYSSAIRCLNIVRRKTFNPSCFRNKVTWRPNYFLLHDPGLIVHEKIKLLALLVHQLTLLLDIKSSLWQNAIINHNYDVKRIHYESRFCCNSELYICIYICVYMCMCNINK